MNMSAFIGDIGIEYPISLEYENYDFPHHAFTINF